MALSPDHRDAVPPALASRCDLSLSCSGLSLAGQSLVPHGPLDGSPARVAPLAGQRSSADSHAAASIPPGFCSKASILDHPANAVPLESDSPCCLAPTGPGTTAAAGQRRAGFLLDAHGHQGKVCHPSPLRKACSTRWANAATVGASNSICTGRTTCSTACTRAITRVASKECPPTRKKLSWMPSLVHPTGLSISPPAPLLSDCVVLQQRQLYARRPLLRHR